MGVGAGTVEVVIDVAVAALVLDVKMKIVAPIVFLLCLCCFYRSVVLNLGAVKSCKGAANFCRLFTGNCR